MDTTRTSITRIVGAVTAAILALALFAAPAGAASATVAYVGLGGGYNDVYNDGTTLHDAGSYNFTLNGSAVVAYCADLTLAFNGSAAFGVQPSGSTAIPNVGKAGWVATYASTVGTPLADTDAEVSAIQLAVWYFTNSITIDPTTVAYQPVRDRALELVAGVGSNTLVSAPTTFNLASTGAIDGTNAVFTSTLTEDGGAPIAGATVSFSGAGVSGSGVTNASGVATFSTPAPAAGASLSVDSSYTGAVAAGSVLIPDDSSQPLIITQPSSVTVTSSAAVTAAAAPTTAPPTTATPTTAPASSATATPAAPVKELPYTGGTLGWRHLAVAVFALAACAVMVVRMRRRAGLV